MMKTMTRMKIYRPNYNLAEAKAIEFLNYLEKKELPIKLIKFKTIFDDLEIKTYSWYSKKMGLSIEKVCDDLGSEDGCCVYNEVNGKYRIYYNDTIENEGRKRWTLAHELGHYALKHHENYGHNIMQRNGNLDVNYDAFEKEANCFARNLIAPPYVIFHIKDVNPSLIQHVCNISFEASWNIFKFIKQGIQEFGRGYSRDLAKKMGFESFLFSINNRFFCKECRCNFILEAPSHCPCCGRKALTKTPFKYGDDFTMKYPAIEVDHKSRARVCPNCQNEEMEYEGDFCKICGYYIVNDCSNDDGNYNGESCGILLPGNARYCYKCGAKSTFYMKNFLNEWNYNSNAPLEVSEDDLPF
ncbi:Zn-dependent peptidase ImmA (M78 family)/RNA polymerase subunit RPABC4/transcription elongation factor Spt4 [Lysinibacillus parviboronicapiens]|uniref:Zn-dependent peptidase ImmA (M78 family)/RNA polymerase subunit RPABC4/transcription elongation factor Spt4 n=1 Tax=Lysinibacillus parviboronicapiens TaxID=436516 RepID=A0ABV2PIR4_9BACI